EGLVRSAALAAYAPGAVFRVAAPSWPVVVVYYGALAVAALRRPRWPSLPSGLVALAAGAWIVLEPWSLPIARGDSRLHVTFLDVGQGDAAFIRFPRGTTMLVDTGGLAGTSTFDIGDRVVAPVVRLAGVGRLDDVVLTHGDPDHIGGASSLLR